MTCRKCKGEFCWVCLVRIPLPFSLFPSRSLPQRCSCPHNLLLLSLSVPHPSNPVRVVRSCPQGVWKDHTDFYSCNRYGGDKGKEKESAKTASRAALDRYLFYYHRCVRSGAGVRLLFDRAVRTFCSNARPARTRFHAPAPRTHASSIPRSA